MSAQQAVSKLCRCYRDEVAFSMRSIVHLQQQPSRGFAVFHEAKPGEE